MEKPAATQIPIHELIGRRWSSRAFSERPVEPGKLLSVLEAARWAPSSRNEQPWAFVLATRDRSSEFNDLLNMLTASNHAWAQKAPVLILAAAHMAWSKEKTPNRHSFYDLGQAIGSLVTQATFIGLSTHQMAGFDVAAARERFHLPTDWEPVVVIALGYHGDVDNLPEPLREREMAPRLRKPLSEFVFAGVWGTPAVLPGSIEV